MPTAAPELSIAARIAQRLAAAVGQRKYDIWFDRSARLEYRDRQHRLEVAVPNRFVADWIGRHFHEQLRTAAAQELGRDDIELQVQVDPDRFARHSLEPGSVPAGDLSATTAAASAQPLPTAAAAAERSNKPAGGDLTALAQLRYRLDDFIVGPSNQLAFAAAGRLVEQDDMHGSPLFLHGGCGLGKTHLLQGLCRRMLELKPSARVLYTTGEQFTNDFVDAVRSNRIDAFRRRIRRLDLLAVDDIHFLASKQATQQEFLHSFDTIGLSGARVALASDAHPKLIQQFSQALVSRCLSGLVVQIALPDALTKLRIIQSLAARRNLSLLDSVAQVLAQQCQGSVREIEGTLAKLHALASLDRMQRPGAGHDAPSSQSYADAADLNQAAGENPAPGSAPAPAPGSPASAPGSVAGRRLPTIGHALFNRLFQSDFESRPRKIVRVETVLEVVAEQLGVAKTQILGNSRHRHAVLARSVTIYLTRQLTSMSYPEIAAALSRPNHSTVITAAQRISRQLEAKATACLPLTLEELPLAELLERLKAAIVRG